MPGVLAFHLGGQSAPSARSMEEEIVAGSVQDQSERDDAHLRSLGIKPELRRTLGFLSNFAIAFSFISVSTGTYGNFGVGLEPGRTGVLLVVADRHRRPVHRRPGLRRAGEPLPGRGLDLPVVEAPLEPDARLVHGLVLLLGPGRDRDRGRGHRRLRHRRHPRRPRRRTSPSSTRRTRPGLDDDVHVHRARDARHHDADQRLRRSAAVRRSTTSASRPRSSAWSSSP